MMSAETFWTQVAAYNEAMWSAVEEPGPLEQATG